MRFQFSFKHMSVSTALQEYARNKINPLIDKFATKPIEAHITFSVDRHMHSANCVLTGGDGFSIHVEHACDDMYGSIDRMADKMFSQLKKKKDRLKEHKNPRSNLRSMVGHGGGDHDQGEIDADDIIKYEAARRRAASS